MLCMRGRLFELCICILGFVCVGISVRGNVVGLYKGTNDGAGCEELRNNGT